MHTAQDIEKAIRAAANPAKAKVLSGFFKTGKGEYSENDIFIGVPVPVTRSIAKQYLDTPLAELTTLLHSPVHELRMAALLCMVEQFKKADEAQRTALYNTYLAHTACINNWDLVDLSASQIVGGYLEHRDHAPLYRLAQSPQLWEQRIAIVSYAKLRVGCCARSARKTKPACADSSTPVTDRCRAPCYATPSSDSLPKSANITCKNRNTSQSLPSRRH